MFFEQFLRRVRPLIEERWGAELAERVTREARDRYPGVASGLPDIGGRRNIFTPVITVNGWLIALHEGMKRNGRSAEDTIAVAFAVTDGMLRSLPVRLLKRIGRLAFASPARRLFRRQAERSQEKRYAADFVYQIEETAEGELSFVFSECAVNKLYDAKGLTDLKPYCNFFDVTYSRLMDMGVDAHETIGLGCDHCALRFKHGRETEVPAALRPIIRGAKA